MWRKRDLIFGLVAAAIGVVAVAIGNWLTAIAMALVLVALVLRVRGRSPSDDA